MSLRITTLKDDTETIILVNSVNGDIIQVYDIKGIRDYISKGQSSKGYSLKDYFTKEEIIDFTEVYELGEEQ